MKKMTLCLSLSYVLPAIFIVFNLEMDELGHALNDITVDDRK